MTIKRTGWGSTDELERAIREEQGREEAMRVRWVGNKDGVFGDCEVAKGEGADRNVYRVELRSLEGSGNWCSCPDFAKSGLGLCKHIARVAASARRRVGKKGAVSPFTEVWVEAESGRVRVAFAEDAPLWERARLGKLLDGEGRLVDGSAEGLAKLLVGTTADIPSPAESGNFIAIRDALTLSDADALTLQCAIQGQDPGDARIRVPAFLSLCRAKLGD